MYKVLIAGAAMLASGVANAAVPNRIAYGAVNEHMGCAAIQQEARVVQSHVIELGAALSHKPDLSMAPFADMTGTVAPLRLELELARSRLLWLRQVAGDANCSSMPTWHELEQDAPWRNPLA